MTKLPSETTEHGRRRRRQRSKHYAASFYTAFTNVANASQRLKSALWYAVGQIVDEECLQRNRNATPQFIGALTEMVWTQIGTHFLLWSTRNRLTTGSIENVAIDLESFSSHADRSTVTTDDVLLLARKNPDLRAIMGEFVDARKAMRDKGKRKR